MKPKILRILAKYSQKEGNELSREAGIDLQTLPEHAFHKPIFIVPDKTDLVDQLGSIIHTNCTITTTIQIAKQ